MTPPPKLNRRLFFRSAFSKVLEPIAGYLEEAVPTHRKAKEILRPPGAVPEEEFLDRCNRCWECVKSCPADAIVPLKSNNSSIDGTPMVDPENQPCVLCSSLACMDVCPTNALEKIPLSEIKIGIAEVNHETCLSSSETKCRSCIESCPIGEEAIFLNSQWQIEVVASICCGCGICQFQCPTDSKSIVVKAISY